MFRSQSSAHAPQSVGRLLRDELSRALLDILIAGLIGVIVGGMATEAAVWIVTGAVPQEPAHIAAALVALLLGYALALTVAFRALLRGIVQSAEWAFGEVERLVNVGAHEAESVVHAAQGQRATSSRVVEAETPARASRPETQPVMSMIGGIVDES